MIFFVDNGGNVVKSLPSPVNQGSANANNVYLIAPFAENSSVTVAFMLPNGVWTERFVMSPVNEIAGVVDEKSGQTYSGWSFAIPNTITKYYGNVTAQFYFYSAQAGVIVASSSVTFPVARGVPEILPEAPSADVYAAILSNIAALQGQLNNGAYTARAIYAWNPTYDYNANEITYYPDVGLFGAFVKSKTADNLNHPPYNADGELDSQYWEVVLDFNTIKGEKGDPGEAATITVGKVTTGAPGSQAEVINAGTEQTAIFDITIPAGKQGPKGDKGDPGIGNATLSNTDGDSTENGSTQAAVKGVMQAKNYYNLGAFDTFVSNGDGTGTVTRKTGYADITNTLLEKGGIRSTTPGNYEFGGDNVINLAVKNSITFVSTVLQPNGGNEVWNGQQGIAIISYRGCWICVNGLTTNEQYKAWLANNKILVQYELAAEYQYTEQVIENQPIRLANQEEEWYWHGEWLKGLNLFSVSNYVRSDYGATFTVLNKNQIKVTQGTTNYSRAVFSANCLAGENYYFSATTDNITRVAIFDNNDNQLADFVNENNFNFQFTTLIAGKINIYLYSTNAQETIFSNIMLNKGKNYGKLLHEIDLSGVQLFPEGVNPAETIGGDWEDNGTVTTSDNTVFHAYRRLS